MHCYEVLLNNIQISVAGSIDTDVLSATLSGAVSGPIALTVYGLLNNGSDGGFWINRSVDIGDEIVFILKQDNSSPDKPSHSIEFNGGL